MLALRMFTMKLPNYLLMLLDNKDDESIRVDVTKKHLIKSWAQIENKNIFIKNHNLNKNNIHNYLRRGTFIPVSVLQKIVVEWCKQKKKDSKKHWDKVFDEVKMFKSESSKSQAIKLPKHMTEDLAYLVGALRDGCLVTYSGNKNHFGVIFTQESCKEWLNSAIISKLRKLFGVIKPANADGELQIYNKPLFKFFEKVFEHPPGDQSFWATPRLIEQSNNKVKIAYIRGFFDAEGVCSASNKYLGFVQNNRESLVFLHKELTGLGLRCGKIYRDRNTHRFWISNRPSVNLFCDLIGSEHPERKAKLALFRS